MFKPPNNFQDMSVKLSLVLDEIGVNEKTVVKRRRARLMEEMMTTITNKTSGNPISTYLLGSQSEGTTTPGLQSDADYLECCNVISILQDWSEWTPGATALLMIQDEATPPGYCRLQRLRSDVPLPHTEEQGNHYIRDTSGKILLKNTYFNEILPEGRKRQGPALSKEHQPGILDEDLVLAYPFKSLTVRHWPNYQDGERWRTEDMKRYMEGTQCFVVGAGSKISDRSEFEWRVSTTLSERCLMFNLNITQLRCYILLKMILKTYVKPHFDGLISSFMCKNVLLHCINSKHSSIWEECNILNCLSYCLLTLYNCLLNENCPHFIIKQNNLMAERFSKQEKHQLLELTLNLIQNIDIFLLGIQTDDLGIRLKIKLDRIPQEQHLLKLEDENNELITYRLLKNTARNVIKLQKYILSKLKYKRLQRKIEILYKHISAYKKYHREDNNWVKAACQLCAPVLCTSLGTLIASCNIQQSDTVSPQALDWLSVGLNSDVASSRLKLASVLYCTRDFERTAIRLTDVQERYNVHFVSPVCACYDSEKHDVKVGSCAISRYVGEKAIRHIMAFCVSFLPCEINSVPHELQYEMFRSTEEDRIQRGEKDRWMDNAVVDSLPYLYFLQYKTFGHLQRNEEKQIALINLMWAINNERTLSHKETALNLLGQCMEQENQTNYAIYYYMLSLGIRKRNNAASMHICVLLSKHFNNDR